jgi:predicted metalloprotease with PDZ domain
MVVKDKSPAAMAGLRPGDAIVAVAGDPLPVNSLAPGWTWYRQSHEAVLGRAVLGAEKTLRLTVLRDKLLTRDQNLLDNFDFTETF